MADTITRDDIAVLNQAYWWFAEVSHKEPEGDVTPEMVDSLRKIYYYLENDLDVKQMAESDDGDADTFEALPEMQEAGRVDSQEPRTQMAMRG